MSYDDCICLKKGGDLEKNNTTDCPCWLILKKEIFRDKQL